MTVNLVRVAIAPLTVAGIMLLLGAAGGPYAIGIMALGAALLIPPSMLLHLVMFPTRSRRDQRRTKDVLFVELVIWSASAASGILIGSAFNLFPRGMTLEAPIYIVWVYFLLPAMCVGVFVSWLFERRQSVH